VDNPTSIRTYRTYQTTYQTILRTNNYFPQTILRRTNSFPRARLIAYQTLFVKQWYNLYMSPRHFARYAKQDPKQYNQFSDSMWNGFVSVTKHIPIVGRFFSFTPADFPGVPEDILNPRKIGRELGKVYKEANSDTE